jgi:hypothetical protein
MRDSDFNALKPFCIFIIDLIIIFLEALICYIA